MGAVRRGKGSGTLVPRGEATWLIRIDQGRNPVTWERDRRNVTVSGTKAAAQKKMTETLGQREQGVAVAPDRITVGEWLPGWLDRHFVEGKISERIRTRCLGIISRHIVPLGWSQIGHNC